MLNSLRVQEKFDDSRFEIVVVDNDADASARSTVVSFENSLPCALRYSVCSIKNISLARNAAIEAARNDTIVFIDDDQLCAPNMLRQLDKVWSSQPASIQGLAFQVQGRFEPNCSPMLSKCRVFKYSVLKGIQDIRGEDMSTNGVLFRKSLVHDDSASFDPYWGVIGGEDNAFFYSLSLSGARFRSVEGIVVIERFLPERVNLRYMCQVAYRKGMCLSLLHLRLSSRPRLLKYVLLSLAHGVAAAVVLPLAMMRGPTGAVDGLLLLLRQVGKVGGLLRLHIAIYR